MEAPIIAAIIASVTAIVAPVVTFVATKYIESLRFKRLAGNRRHAITGKWRGIVSEDKGAKTKPIDLEISFELRASARTITGTCEIAFVWEGSPQRAQFDVTGGFRHDRFLELSFTSQGHELVAFGSILIELDLLGQRMSGKCVGFSPRRAEIIKGTVDVTKAA